MAHEGCDKYPNDRKKVPRPWFRQQPQQFFKALGRILGPSEEISKDRVNALMRDGRLLLPKLSTATL